MTPQQFTTHLRQLASRISHMQRAQLPNILAEKATAYFKQRFTTKEWDGVPWPATKRKVKRGSLMVRSSNLVNSIQPKTVTAELIVISAGNSKVAYAQIHNEGGTIQRHARSELFVRNRITKGKRKGKFKKGTTAGRGYTFGASTATMPKRQFMGHSPVLNQHLINAIQTAFNQVLTK